MKKNYLIKFTVKDKNGIIIKSGKIRAKNRYSEIDAKCKLEEFMKKKYINFGSLIVHNCIEDNIMNSIFGDWFKDGNPLGF